MIKMFKNLTKKEILFFLLSVIFIVVQVFADLKIPDYMQEITVLVQTEGSAIGDILVEYLKRSIFWREVPSQNLFERHPHPRDRKDILLPEIERNW